MVLHVSQCRLTGLDWINMPYLKVLGISIEGIGYQLCDSSHLFWENLSLLLLLYSACAFKHVASSYPVSDRTDTCRFLQGGAKLWTLDKCIMLAFAMKCNDYYESRPETTNSGSFLQESPAVAEKPRDAKACQILLQFHFAEFQIADA